MNNVIRAWITIVAMGAATTAAAAYSTNRCDQAGRRPAVRTHAVRHAKAIQPSGVAPVSAPAQDTVSTAAKPPPIKPAPRPAQDTRQLSRLARRSA
ncbi:MAG TPA: hypothetical protein VH475_14350 [Tepidisphaeraceae bacterium]